MTKKVFTKSDWEEDINFKHCTKPHDPDLKQCNTQHESRTTPSSDGVTRVTIFGGSCSVPFHSPNSPISLYHRWQNLFQSRGHKWSSKIYRKLLWLNWQLWRHKHWNMASLTFVSIFKEFYAMFYKPSTTPIYTTPMGAALL